MIPKKTKPTAKPTPTLAPRPPANPPAPTATHPHPLPMASSAALAPAEAPAWLDSNNPQKRLWGRLILIAVVVYIAALWLLALDQIFNWGIFGAKNPNAA